MKNGVPWDVAFGVSDNLRTAMGIVFGEMEGSTYNWNTMKFEERK